MNIKSNILDEEKSYTMTINALAGQILTSLYNNWK